MQLIKVDLAGWRSLAIFDCPVPSYVEPIRTFLSRHLSPAELRLLAHPAEFGRSYRWFAHHDAPVVPLGDLNERERDAAQTAFFAVRRRIDGLIAELQRAAGPPPPATAGPGAAKVVPRSRAAAEAERFAMRLSRLNLTPDRRLLFVQDGCIVRAGWGGELPDADLFDDPSSRPPPTIDKGPDPARTWLKHFGRTRSGEVALDLDAADAVRQEADARVAARSAAAATGMNRITLMWENANDLDLSLIAPDGRRVYFGNKRVDIEGAVAELDIDTNAASGGAGFDKVAPVENITVGRFSIDGVWQIVVTHYKHRLPAPISCRFRVALQIDRRLRLFQGTLAAGDHRVVAVVRTHGGEIVSVDGGA